MQVDGGEPEIEIQDSVGSEGYSRLDVSRAPVVVTLARSCVTVQFKCSSPVYTTHFLVWSTGGSYELAAGRHHQTSSESKI